MWFPLGFSYLRLLSGRCEPQVLQANQAADAEWRFLMSHRQRHKQRWLSTDSLCCSHDTFYKCYMIYFAFFCIVSSVTVWGHKSAYHFDPDKNESLIVGLDHRSHNLLQTFLFPSGLHVATWGPNFYCMMFWFWWHAPTVLTSHHTSTPLPPSLGLFCRNNPFSCLVHFLL